MNYREITSVYLKVWTEISESSHLMTLIEGKVLLKQVAECSKFGRRDTRSCVLTKINF